MGGQGGCLAPLILGKKKMHGKKKLAGEHTQTKVPLPPLAQGLDQPLDMVT